MKNAALFYIRKDTIWIKWVVQDEYESGRSRGVWSERIAITQTPYTFHYGDKMGVSAKMLKRPYLLEPVIRLELTT